MKNYKKFLLLGIILSLLVPISGLCEEKVEERDLLMGILEETDATFLEGDINIGGAIIDRFIGENEIREIGEDIRILLDIQGTLRIGQNVFDEGLEGDYYSEEITGEEGFIQLMVWGFDTHHNLVTFILSSYEEADVGLGETSLFINLIKREQFSDFNGIIEEIENIFKEYNKPVDITTCIVGTFDGKLTLEEKEEKIIRAIKVAKGKTIEKYEEDTVVSFSVFTPYIEKYIYTGNKKMNLNIAARYNEHEDKTYIWIGTPIITIGY